MAKRTSAKSSKATSKKASKKAAKKATKKTTARRAAAGKSAVASVGSADWRADTLGYVRSLITQAIPGVVEEVKWRKPTNPAGVPVWSHPAGAIICTGETYKTAVKLTFFKGAALEDPEGVFNSGLDSNVRRVIDLHEGDKLDEAAFKNIMRAAAALNARGTKK